MFANSILEKHRKQSSFTKDIKNANINSCSKNVINFLEISMSDILFLEDDKLLAQSVVEELEDAKYHVDWVQEGEDALQKSFDKRYSLYLFDVNVPGINGFELLKQLRESGDRTAAIFLTSKNQIDDLKYGFNVGADDYIKKPFDLSELLIRIGAKMPNNSKKHFSEFFSIDPKIYMVNCRGKETTVAQKEFRLLEYLCDREATLLSPDDIIYALYEDSTISIATFRTYIKNIKRHFSDCIEIENIKGLGYRLKVLKENPS